MFETAKRNLYVGALMARHRLSRDRDGTQAVARCNRDKQVILTVNAGRSGSAKLAQLFGCLTQVDARHEPAPSFHRFMRASQKRPDVSRAFLVTAKLPAILASPEPVYFEASHLFSKGFFEPAVELGLRFALIHLHREPALIARSFFLLHVVPGRSRLGLKHCLAPFDDTFLKLPGWEELSDYQLCYWYALEMERRGAAYLELARGAGLRTASIATECLSREGAFEALCEEIGVEVDAASALRLVEDRDQRINLKEKSKRREAQAPPADAAEQERIVRKRLVQGAPAAFRAVSERLDRVQPPSR